MFCCSGVLPLRRVSNHDRIRSNMSASSAVTAVLAFVVHVLVGLTLALLLGRAACAIAAAIDAALAIVPLVGAAASRCPDAPLARWTGARPGGRGRGLSAFRCGCCGGVWTPLPLRPVQSRDRLLSHPNQITAPVVPPHIGRESRQPLPEHLQTWTATLPKDRLRASSREPVAERCSRWSLRADPGRFEPPRFSRRLSDPSTCRDERARPA